MTDAPPDTEQDAIPGIAARAVRKLAISMATPTFTVGADLGSDDPVLAVTDADGGRLHVNVSQLPELRALLDAVEREAVSGVRTKASPRR